MTEQSLALAVASGLSGHQGGRLIIPAKLTCHGAAPAFDPIAPQSLTSVGSFVKLEPDFEPKWLMAPPGFGASLPYIFHGPNFQRVKRLFSEKQVKRRGYKA